jgi:membrane protein required for colicin V production
MNLVDLTVLGIVGISALLGLSRGFVREMLGLAAWTLAGLGAVQYGPLLEPTAARMIGDPEIASVAAYVGTFLILVVVLSLLSNLIGRMVRVSALGGLDRTLGLAFGLARGAAVMIAVFILGCYAMPHPEAWPPPVKQARTVPLLRAGAVWVADMLPKDYRPPIPPLPDDKPTTAAELLQVSPEGSALGKRAVHN